MIIKNVYLSGLGAVGGAYVGKLFDMDPGYITVIADEKRISKYKEKGVTINSKLYAFKYIHPEDEYAPADLIIIAVKQHQLEQSIKDISKFVGKNTIILSLLNGISSEEIIGERFGMDKLLYAFCVGIDSVKKDTDIHYTNIGRIVFGERANIKLSAKVSAVKELFEKAGIPHVIPENMIREMWWKFMINVGINQASAILRAPYGVFQHVKEARDLMIMASREVLSISEKAGINLNEEDIKNYLSVIDTLSPEGKTSMLQDIEAMRKTEVEIFAGTVIELGIKYEVDTPVNNFIYKSIRTLEKMYLE
jgi:2-dehydropantoate 2-reductase